ncbi:MAG TPA: GNAT family N-acetyltransferase [Allosphingosinicella sp.]|jgi:RimJ/RimL family protein N-acetyltransferase
MIPIQTERLLLRDWTEADIEPWLELNTQAVMRWLGGVRSREQAVAAITERFMPWQEGRGFTFWAVERKYDGKLLGFCGIKIADDAGSPVEGELEVGWRLREDVWGKGYAKEAAAASLDHAFRVLGADGVVALTVAGNLASWGLMERLGMSRRPDLDYEGPDWAEGTVIVYRIEKKPWLKSSLSTA